MRNDLAAYRNKVAVVGVGLTEFGSLPDHDETSLGIWALKNAMQDAGVSSSDIDGLVTVRLSDYQRVGRATGIKPSFFSVLPGAGPMLGVGLVDAFAAITSGAVNTVALLYGNNGRSAGVQYGGSKTGNSGDAYLPYGLTSQGGMWALMCQRHMSLYGTTSEQLAEIAVAFRRHAELNPGAIMRKPITRADHQSSRHICEPLRLFDYCLINDGGVAIILTSSERAKDFAKRPVYIRGISQASDFTEEPFAADFGNQVMRSAAGIVFEMADVTTNDMDGLMIYDNFTPNVLFALEGYGYCPVGESGRFVAEGHLALGRRFPTNTSGGHLSESYMQGWALQVEAVRQLRRECDERQIINASLIQFIAPGNETTSIIYGRDPQ